MQNTHPYKCTIKLVCTKQRASERVSEARFINKNIDSLSFDGTDTISILLSVTFGIVAISDAL